MSNEEINLYDMPFASLEPETKPRAVAPVERTSVFAKYVEGFRLLFSNLAVIGPVILTVWLPGNLLVSYITYSSDSENLMLMFRLNSFIEGFLGPIYVAGIIYALAKRKTGQPVTYTEALQAGLRNWSRLFGTRFFTGMIILAGFIALIIPGLLLLVKYSVVDEVVVLEGTTGPAARSRSSDLTKGRRWQVLVAWFLYLLIVIPIEIAGDWIFESLGLMNNMWTSSAILCAQDILRALIVIVMFLIYWESEHATDAKKVASGALDLDF